MEKIDIIESKKLFYKDKNMTPVEKDYKTLVLDDMATFDGLAKPIRASVLERICTKNLNINQLHPNPTDEFSMENIGPNFGIVSDYTQSMRKAQSLSMPVMDEPIIVEKMSTGEYMILNGHHRWLAAHKADVKKVPVQIVNVAPDEEIFEKVKNSANTMCVSIDLDEVLLADRNSYPTKEKPFFLSKKLFPKILRYNAGALINELRNDGFDVWIYTNDFHSSEYIDILLRHQHTRVDGIVNGLSRKKSKDGLKKAFINKYKYSIHIDNEGIICVNNSIKDFESIDIETTQNNWAADIMKAMKQLKLD